MIQAELLYQSKVHDFYCISEVIITFAALLIIVFGIEEHWDVKLVLIFQCIILLLIVTGLAWDYTRLGSAVFDDSLYILDCCICLLFVCCLGYMFINKTKIQFAESFELGILVISFLVMILRLIKVVQQMVKKRIDKPQTIRLDRQNSMDSSTNNHFMPFSKNNHSFDGNFDSKFSNNFSDSKGMYF